MRGLTFGELLDYSTEETSHWRDWFDKNPALLDLACDITGAKTVREVVLHIVVVQMRYAERLRNQRVTEYEELASSTAPELFLLARKSAEDLRSFAVAANDADWGTMLTFPTRSAGTLTASRRKIFIHAVLHGLRHWAQLATFLRQQGHPQSWQHDFIAASVMK